MQQSEAAVFDTGGHTVTFTPSGIWIYDEHRSSVVYVNRFIAFDLAAEIISRFKDARP